LFCYSLIQLHCVCCVYHTPCLFEECSWDGGMVFQWWRVVELCVICEYLMTNTVTECLSDQLEGKCTILTKLDLVQTLEEHQKWKQIWLTDEPLQTQTVFSLNDMIMSRTNLVLLVLLWMPEYFVKLRQWEREGFHGQLCQKQHKTFSRNEILSLSFKKKFKTTIAFLWLLSIDNETNYKSDKKLLWV